MVNEKYLIQYAGYMEEVKKRTDVCLRLLTIYRAGNSMTGYKETDIDILYLQIRKIFELVMFASVVAHRFNSAKIKRDADSAYNAGKLMNFIKEINPDFYPSPKYDSESIDGVRQVKDLSNEDGEVFLTEEEMRRVYNRVCGNFSHAKRQYHYGNDVAKFRHFESINIIIGKITALLNHHWIKLDENVSFAVIMKGEDGNVGVSVLEILE